MASRSQRRRREVNWSGVTSFITALTAVGALYLADKSFDVTSDQVADVQEERHSELRSRLVRELNQPGPDQTEVRLNAAHSLGLLAHDYPTDQPYVIKMLTSFVRSHTPTQQPGSGCPTTSGIMPPLTQDVQAALDVLGRRNTAHDNGAVVDLKATCLVGADLSFADLNHAHLSGADLTGADLTFAKLMTARLDGADLSHADLGGAVLAGASLHETDLTGAELISANLTQAFLGGAELKEANFYNATLDRTLFFDANLDGANLHQAELNETVLTGASLRGADLRFADLIGAFLRGADLSGAALAYANFRGADIRGADLRGATHNGTNLDGAHTDGQTEGQWSRRVDSA